MRNRAWVWIERGLFVAGISLVTTWAFTLWSAARFQASAGQQFDRALEEQTRSPADAQGSARSSGTAQRSAATTESRASRVASRPHKARSTRRAVASPAAIGRIVIPRLGISSVIAPDIYARTLDRSVGHIPWTARPGGSGTVGLAAHRDRYFKKLGDIRRDDVIQVTTLGGTYVYEVERTAIVRPNRVDVLRSGRRHSLVLVTCYPFRYIGPAPDRFVVWAKQVGPPLRETQKTPPNGRERVRRT